MCRGLTFNGHFVRDFVSPLAPRESPSATADLFRFHREIANSSRVSRIRSDSNFLKSQHDERPRSHERFAGSKRSIITSEPLVHVRAAMFETHLTNNAPLQYLDIDSPDLRGQG